VSIRAADTRRARISEPGSALIPRRLDPSRDSPRGHDPVARSDVGGLRGREQRPPL